MPYIQKYSILEPLPLIKHHKQLPSDSMQLAHLIDPYSVRKHDYAFLKCNNHLGILISYTKHLKNGISKYKYCQYDFPLKVLSWFPKALGLEMIEILRPDPCSSLLLLYKPAPKISSVIH